VIHRVGEVMRSFTVAGCSELVTSIARLKSLDAKIEFLLRKIRQLWKVLGCWCPLRRITNVCPLLNTLGSILLSLFVIWFANPARQRARCLITDGRAGFGD
jgi:hypothetical protein